MPQFLLAHTLFYVFGRVVKKCPTAMQAGPVRTTRRKLFFFLLFFSPLSSSFVPCGMRKIRLRELGKTITALAKKEYKPHKQPVSFELCCYSGCQTAKAVVPPGTWIENCMATNKGCSIFKIFGLQLCKITYTKYLTLKCSKMTPLLVALPTEKSHGHS